MSLAGYVAYTRVDDNLHHVDDIVVGSLVGASFSFITYSYQNSKVVNRPFLFDSLVSFNVIPIYKGGAAAFTVEF